MQHFEQLLQEERMPGSELRKLLEGSATCMGSKIEIYQKI